MDWKQNLEEFLGREVGGRAPWTEGNAGPFMAFYDYLYNLEENIGELRNRTSFLLSPQCWRNFDEVPFEVRLMLWFHENKMGLNDIDNLFNLGLCGSWKPVYLEDQK